MAIMSPATTLKTLLLTSLLCTTTSAFVPLEIHPPIDNNNFQLQPQPTPSELDPLRWVPIATLAPLTDTFVPTVTSIPTPSPSLESGNDYEILPILDPLGIPELKRKAKDKRQAAIGQGGGAAAPTVVSQISPVTTYFINSEVAPGSFAQVPIVYTQTFVPIPDQWESPVAGTIGMGTITGEIGVIRTKRSLPTQAPAVVEATKTMSWSA